MSNSIAKLLGIAPLLSGVESPVFAHTPIVGPASAAIAVGPLLCITNVNPSLSFVTFSI